MGNDTADRLRDLCEQAVAAKDYAEVERLLVGFRLALEAHIEEARIALGC